MRKKQEELVPDFDFILPNRLKELRREKYLSQGEIAKRMTVHKSTVSMWENHEMGIKDSNKIKLCKLLKCEITTLFDWGPYK